MKVIYDRIGLKLYKTEAFKDIFHIVKFRRYCSTSAPQSADSGKKQYIATAYTCPTAPGEKKDTTCELPAAYNPQYVEAAWYEWWMKQGYFSPKEGVDASQKFVICLPPPNVTGTLHLGHALTCAVQDAIVRWHRMRGYETLWIPGCDHAGIATQVVVEKQLWKEEKKTRHDVGRDEFLQHVWKWKESKGDTIYEQMKKMGASLDWERACFTMDKKMSAAVTEAFVRLHDEGLIYRCDRLVNWSCELKSAISDIEVENVDLKGPTRLSVPGYSKPQVFGEMASFDYPVLNSDEKITVSTTRLETMLGDTAVAVHPEDPRYKHLHGQFVQHPLDDRRIPIICDDYVDMNFGTGAVKITPAHDNNDYNIGVRHKLPLINIINDRGEMENVPESFLGLKRFDARRAVAKALDKKGLYKGRQPHSMVLPICSRSKDVIEPRLKAQWYINCEDMALHAVKVVENGDLTFTPDYYKKIWYEFLKDEKSRDWCISRQIWWGHRIPAYKVIQKTNQSTSDELWVSAHTEHDAYIKAEKLFSLNPNEFTLYQDEDVLDTWFSSALFPFSVHGWPNQTTDLLKFYPSNLLETGSDIIFYWVARMVMLGQKMTGELPFSKVLLHGILRDAQGRKMSKSLGNVIDPMDVVHGISLKDLNKQVEQSNLDPKEVEVAKKGQQKDFPEGIPACGTDALRFALCSYNFKDPEINMNITHVQSYRNFCNKIWQGYRFVADKIGDDYESSIDLKTHTIKSPVDRWMLSRLSHLVLICEENFASYDLHHVTQALYSFWFTDFCDVYIEYSKQVFQSEDDNNKSTVQEILYLCTSTYMRAISPFMPYLSEELYQRLEPGADSVCVAQYPATDIYRWYNEELDREMEVVRDIRRVTLSLAQTFNLTKKHAEVYIQSSPAHCDMLRQYLTVFNALLRVKSLQFVSDSGSIPAGCIHRVITPEITVHLKLQGSIDHSAVLDKFEKKVASLQKNIDGIEKKLGKAADKDKGADKKIDSYRSELVVFQNYIDTLKSFDENGR